MTQPTTAPARRQRPFKDQAAYPATETGDDIVQDILSLVLSMAPGFTAALARQVDAQVRERWGGDRPYIARRQGEGLSSRNAAIRRDYLAGERISLLERRYELSKSRIMQIIKD